MPDFSIYQILLTNLAFYTRLNNNTLLSSYLLIWILLYIKFGLIVPFPNLPRNINLVFFVKLTVMAKKTRLNKKQISLSFGFAYTKYNVQRATLTSAILDLRQKMIQRTAKSYKQFCSIYVQLLRLQSLERVSLLKYILLNNINNQPHHEF